MQVVSVEFRKELGRCHDEDIGGRMMQTEPRIDALGSKIANGGITSTVALAKEFAECDRLLAEHHHQLAAEGLTRPRASKMPAVARDLTSRGAARCAVVLCRSALSTYGRVASAA